MKVLFDTNVILDVLLDRQPHSAAASALMSRVESGELTGFLCATTVTTIHYLATRAIGRPMAREKLELLLKLFEIAPVNRLVLQEAMTMKSPDFEDGVLMASAHHAGLDMLVTRNPKDYRSSPVPTHVPEALLKILSDA